MSISINALLLCIAAGSLFGLHGNDVVDCPRRSLASEVDKAKTGETISFTGVCAGPVVIRTANVTLRGTGGAVIDGGTRDAVVIVGTHGVSLANFEVRNGANGILGVNGAHLTITRVTSRKNEASGISLQTSSSALLSDITVSENKLHGLDLQTGASAQVTGNFDSNTNRVFGINVNGSALTFSRATATISRNTLGMQVATGGNAFINDSVTVLQFLNNVATGLTIVSGGHMVSFGGRINSHDNGAFGVSVNSNAGLDLDAGSLVSVLRNRAGGLALQQQSAMTVFNNTMNTGVPGNSAIDASNNTGNGISVLTGSTLTLVNQAQITGSANGAFGLLADHGAGVTLRNTSLTGNTVRDLQLTFGARADIQTSVSFGTHGCDRTVLVRGASLTCTP